MVYVAGPVAVQHVYLVGADEIGLGMVELVDD